jgi:hypothetical protein
MTRLMRAWPMLLCKAAGCVVFLNITRACAAEMKLVSAELRARCQRHNRQLTITARHLAEFIESLAQEEALQTQLLSAAEGKQVVALINDAPLHEETILAEAERLAPAPETAGMTDLAETLPPLADYQV